MIQMLIGFGVGVWAETFLGWGLALAGLFLVLAFGLASVAWRKQKNYWLAVWLCVGLALGVARVNFIPVVDNNLTSQVGKQNNFTAVVVAEPDQRDNSTLLVLQPENSSNKILAILPAYADYNYGDKLVVSGKLSLPENFETDAGKVFDYQKYLEKDGVFFIIQRPEVKVIETGAGNKVMTKLFVLKHAFINNLEQKIPEPESSLLAGLVVGEKQALGKEWSDRFRAAGLSHIVVLSGYNLSIVAENILRVFSLFLSRNLSLLAGAFGIIGFALMVGGGATVLRASIMALIALLARATGRVYAATVALAVAGGLMLLWNPPLLVYDLGFQLSFLATLGVIHGPVILAPFFSRLTDRFGFKEILLTTLSAQIIVLPWILYTTGNLSLWALPANLLVLPVIPFTMLSGFVTSVVTFLSSFLAWPFALVSHLLLAYILLIVKIVSSLPLADLTIKQFPLVLTILAYILIFKFYNKSTKLPKNLPDEKEKSIFE
jgi:competence protein ComEC